MSGRSSTRTSGAVALAVAALSLGSASCSRDSTAATPEVTLAAAASLRNVLPALIQAFRLREGGPDLAVTYGASGDLRKQVESGAPIDGVLFANAKPVDELITRKHADGATRKVVATNRLVLIGPKGAKPLTFATVDQIPAGEYLAIGEPAAVPAGQYAKDYLIKLGKWDALQGRLVFGGDVAAVLAYARRGEVAAAVVYKTEVIGIDDVVTFEEATGEGAPKAEVVVAVVSKGASGAGGEGKAGVRAAAFLEFLSTAEAQTIFQKHGFGSP
jgi:molybdate transport system substrate-binding protein